MPRTAHTLCRRGYSRLKATKSLKRVLLTSQKEPFNQADICRRGRSRSQDQRTRYQDDVPCHHVAVPGLEAHHERLAERLGKRVEAHVLDGLALLRY